MDREPPSKPAYTFVPDLFARVDLPEEGRRSTTVHAGDDAKAFLLALADGEALGEHATPRSVVLQVLDGHVDLDLGNDRYQVGPGAWVHLPPGVPHALRAEGPAVLLILQFGHAAP